MDGYWFFDRGSRSGFSDGDGSGGGVDLGFCNRNRSCTVVTVRSLEELETHRDWFC